MARSGRMQKVDSLLATELAALFQRDVEFPHGSVVSIIRVETGRDLKHAKVALSVLPEGQSEAVLKILEEARKDLETALYKRLVMKFTPQLHFVVDHSLVRQAYMESVLDSIPHEE